MEEAITYHDLTTLMTVDFMAENFTAIGCEKRGLELFAENSHTPIGVLSLVIAVGGIVFNILNIAVLVHPQMRSPVNLLLTFLAFSELGLLIIFIPFIILFNLAAPKDQPAYVTKSAHAANYLLFYVDASVFLHISSVWTIITTACFRFLLVQFPIRAVKWCSFKRAILAGVLTYVACFLLNVPNILRNDVGIAINGSASESQSIHFPCHRIEDGVSYYTVILSPFAEKYYLESINYWLFATAGKFIPGILLLIFTIFLVKVLHEAVERRKRLLNSNRRPSAPEKDKPPSDYGQTTRMLLAVVIVLFVIEFPHGILVLWAGLTDNMAVYDMLGELIDLLTLLAFSINFVLYSVMSRQYRALFLELVSKPLKPLQYEGLHIKYGHRRCSVNKTHLTHFQSGYGSGEQMNGSRKDVAQV